MRKIGEVGTDQGLLYQWTCKTRLSLDFAFANFVSKIKEFFKYNHSTMDTALPQKFPFILNRNLAKNNYRGNRVCTYCDTVVL